jgi:WD40 repeat protein
MMRYSTGRIPDDPGFVKRRKDARRISMTIGLTLAAVIAAAMYVTLFRQQAPTAQHVATNKAVAFHQLAKFTVASVPDSVQLDPHGKIVVVTDSGQVSGWSTTSGRRFSSFATVPDSTPAGSRYLTSLMFSPDGKEFSVLDRGGSDEVAYVWDVATGHATPVPLDVSSPVSPFYAAPGLNGLIAASYSNGTLGLAAMPTGQPDAVFWVNRAAGIGYEISEPVFSPDGKTIAVSDNLGRIYLVNIPGKRLAMALTAEKMYNIGNSINGLSPPLDIDSITFSTDSKRIACGSESGIVRVWDVATGRNVSTFNVNGSASGSAAARPVKTLVFSPDGKMLVTADNADSTLAVWDVASGHKITTLTAGTGNVASAAFATDGTLIVATTSDSASGHRIEIWATKRHSAPALSRSSSQTVTASPTLGRIWGLNQQGYGQREPSKIFNGGDPSGMVAGVHWQDWGAAKAIGEGKALYVTTGVAGAPVESTRVVAFDLGKCGSSISYRAIEWYFPQHGQTFDPRNYINICTGQYIVNGKVTP